MKIKINLVLFLVVSSVLCLNAQQSETKKISLKEAIAFAKANSPVLKNAILDHQAAQKKANEILASGLPQINGQVQFVNNIEIATSALPDFISPALYNNLIKYNLISSSTPRPSSAIFPVQFGVKNSLNASISANQLIFDGTFFLGLKAAQEFVNLSKLSRNQTAIELEINVSKSYYLVLLTEASLAMLDKNIETLEKTSHDINEMKIAGFVEKIDADRIALSLSNATIQREKLKDQYAIVQQLLKLQMGADFKDNFELTDKLDVIGNDVNDIALDINSSNYNKRIEFQILEQQKMLNNYDMKRYQVGYMPSLSAFGSVQRNTFGQEFNDVGKQWYSGAMVGVNLSVPIFDGLRKSNQIQQTKIIQQKIENGQKLLQTSIEIDRYTAKTKFARSKELVALQKKNMQLADEIYKRANLKYKEGVGSGLELSSAESELKTAQTNYLSSVYELLVSEIDLKKSLGEIK